MIARERGASAGLFWNTYNPAWFKSAAKGASSAGNRLTVLDHTLDLYVCAGPTPLDVIAQYTALTGRSETPPAWVLLPWKTRTGPVTEADTFEELRKNVQDAAVCHFEDANRPKVIRLHIVKEELIAV